MGVYVSREEVRGKCGGLAQCFCLRGSFSRPNCRGVRLVGSVGPRLRSIPCIKKRGFGSVQRNLVLLRSKISKTMNCIVIDGDDGGRETCQLLFMSGYQSNEGVVCVEV